MSPLEAWTDVSVPLRDGMLHWPGDRPVRISADASIARGDEANLTALDLSAHTGTHMDAPRHFLNGAAGIDALAPEVVIGPARVVAIDDPDSVKASELARHEPRSGERLLLRTRNSQRAWWEEAFDRSFVHLDPEAACLVASAGVRLLGIDYLSVGGLERGAETHRALLGGGAWILEGLNLGGVEPGEYELLCLPLRIVGADGAPARALLRDLPQSEHGYEPRRRDG